MTSESIQDAAKRTGLDLGDAKAETPGSASGAEKKEDTGSAAKPSGRGGARPGSGRKKKSAAPDHVMPADQWAIVVGGLLDMVCEAWQIEQRAPEQKKALATTSLAVIDKHLSIGDHAEEVALAIVAVSIGAPMVMEKMAADRAWDDTEAARAQAEEEQDVPPVSAS